MLKTYRATTYSILLLSLHIYVCFFPLLFRPATLHVGAEGRCGGGDQQSSGKDRPPLQILMWVPPVSSHAWLSPTLKPYGGGGWGYQLCVCVMGTCPDLEYIAKIVVTLKNMAALQESAKVLMSTLVYYTILKITKSRLWMGSPRLKALQPAAIGFKEFPSLNSPLFGALQEAKRVCYEVL